MYCILMQSTFICKCVCVHKNTHVLKTGVDLGVKIENITSTSDLWIPWIVWLVPAYEQTGVDKGDI